MKKIIFIIFLCLILGVGAAWPDTKISDLTELTEVDPTGDWLPIVDTSATATKKIKPYNAHLGAGKYQ
jgi:hypothetical protein